jgi:ribosomal protein S18 acetylase RimI-like enzyme
MGLTEDGWLSERFGHPVFTVGIEGDPEREAAAVLDHAREAGAASYQARVPADRTDAVAALTGAGFEVVSVGLTLARSPRPALPAPDAVEVRPADPESDAAVLEIAERSFTHTRFHLDRSIPRQVADQIKRDWAENSLRGKRGDGMLVALRAGEPVGFLAGLSTDAEGGRARVVDLIAVDPGARNAGAGRALVARFAEEAEGYDELRVSTQAANVGATRFYERLGFVSADSAFDLHRHMSPSWDGSER